MAKKGVWILAAVVVVAAGVGGYFFLNYRGDAIPVLLVPDVPAGSPEAAHVERMQGQVFMRGALATDEQPGALPSSFPGLAAGAVPAGWTGVSPNTIVQLGAYLQVGEKSTVGLTTVGHWFVSLDGVGAMLLQDARRNAEGTEHTLSIFVQEGTFRGKSAVDQSKGIFLDVTTASARIHIYEGEIGMNVGPGGRGRMWLASGRAVAEWNDGRRKELGLLGLEDL